MILKTQTDRREHLSPDISNNQVRCNICGSTSYDNFLIVDNYRMVQCLNCRLIFVIPQPSKTELAKMTTSLYSSDQYREIYFSAHEKLKPRFAKVLNEIENYQKNGRLLDIGCSYGFFLETANETWETYGIEVCKRSASYAQNQLGLRVFNGCLTEAKFPDNYFDAITMWDVLEHLPSPRNLLNEAARILKDDGILFIQCPNIDSLMAKLTRYRGWDWLCVPDHLVHFSPQSLVPLLQESNLEIIRIRTWEPLSEFMDNVLPSLDLSGRFRAGSKLSHLSFLSNMVTRKALLGLFTPMVLPLQRLWCSLGLGGLIQVYAVKE